MKYIVRVTTDDPSVDDRGPAALVYGSVLSGFKFYGPFETVDEAVIYHDEHSIEGRLGQGATVVLLHSPEGIA